jgi:hypothetical protein
MEDVYRRLGLPEGQPGRLATARAGRAVVDALRRAASRVHVVESLAQASLPTTEEAVAKSLSGAVDVAAAVAGFRWERLDPLRAAERAAQTQPDPRGQDASATLRALRDAVAADEIVTRLRPALSKAEDAIFSWLEAGQSPDPSLKGSPNPATGPIVTGPILRAEDVIIELGSSEHGPAQRATLRQGTPAEAVLGPLAEFLRAHPDKRVIVEWRVAMERQEPE